MGESVPEGVNYHVVVACRDALPVCRSFAGRKALVDFVQQTYEKTKTGALSDTRIYVFQGYRITLTGGVDRLLVFPDGTSTRVGPLPPDVGATDILLSPLDGVKLPD